MNNSDRALINTAAFKNIVWDYRMSPETFLDILRGKKTIGWFTQDWAIARILEHLDYYTAVKIVGAEVLRARWDSVKSKIFDPAIKRGYEFVLRGEALSSAR